MYVHQCYILPYLSIIIMRIYVNARCSIIHRYSYRFVFMIVTVTILIFYFVSISVAMSYFINTYLCVCKHVIP